MLARCVAVVAALALVAPMPSTGRPGVTGGLRGLVTRSPITPTCLDDVPYSTPARNVGLVFVHSGKSVRTRTDAAGRYRVTLAVGSWGVRSAVPMIGSGVAPHIVRVVAGRVRVVDLDIDTGIR